MASLKQKLPPLGSLLAFEAAARKLSFTQAGEELFVTQTAISRQIRQLEEYLGTPVFERGHRQVTLTPAGQSLLQSVTLGMEHMASTVTQIREHSHVGPMTIASTIAISSLWLNRRLTDFRQQNPDMDVRILATDKDVDLHRDGVDLAIGCGDYDEHSEVKAHFLFTDEVFPVCSPDFLAKHGAINSAEDLLACELLHLDEEHWQGLSWDAIDWPLWFASQGHDTLAIQQGMRVNNYPLLVQMAEAGQGVALGWRHLVAESMGRGSLVKPIEASYISRRGYYLIESRKRALRPEAEILKQWLLLQYAD